MAAEKRISVQAVASILDCSVCLSLLCEPISLSCGHSFCRICLVKSLRRHKKQCPSCREVCHICAEIAPENIALKSLAQLVDADLYQQRVAETADEKRGWAADYPVFFYNQTMLPGNKLSLHLFEPRYKLMMNRIINANRAFAYISTHYAVAEGDIALVAELNEAEFLADGRCILEATLCRRSRVVDHHVEDDTQGLHYCRLEPFQDQAVPEPRLAELQQLRTRAVGLSEQLLSHGHARRIAEGRFGTMPADMELFSMWFASICPITEDERVLALHTTDTFDRLQMCVRSADAYLARRTGATFPIASALGASIASTLSALMGTAAPAVAGAGAVGAMENQDEGATGAAEVEGEEEHGEGDMQTEEGDEGSESSGGLPGFSH